MTVGMERRAYRDALCALREIVVGDPAAGTGADLPPMIDGYASLFGVRSDDLGGFVEQVAAGAFVDSLQTDDIRALWNHDPNFVLGRNRSGTLKLVEDSRGLKFEVKPPDSGWARDLRISMLRKDVTQTSFAFRTLTDRWERIDGVRVRTLLKARLYDVSVVTYPAYPQTSAAARDGGVCDEALASLERQLAAERQVQRRRLQLIELS